MIALSTSLSARQGILIKDRLALERMRTVDTVLFDKTGTLTRGNFAVSGIAAVDGDEGRPLALVGAVESDSEHPLARAIIRAAGVLAPLGFTLSPAEGAVFMSLSTIIVAANAQLLRRLDLRPAVGGSSD